MCVTVVIIGFVTHCIPPQMAGKPSLDKARLMSKLFNNPTLIQIIGLHNSRINTSLSQTITETSTSG